MKNSPFNSPQWIDKNPFTDVAHVHGYEDWYQTNGRNAVIKEKALIEWLLTKFQDAHSALEIGCGTGYFTRWFTNLGYQMIGLDISRQMLDVANCLDYLSYLQANALMLPLVSKSFDLAIMITTLEFIIDPHEALFEALRVSRQGVILGVINSSSHLGKQYKLEGGQIWDVARFYTVNELKQMIQEVFGEKARVIWRTTLLPCWSGALPLTIGGFIGMAVQIY